MKCFYHEEKDAVGQCQQYGKELCKAYYFRDKVIVINTIFMKD